MARHAKAEPQESSARPEPVAYAGVAQAVLAALCTLGWIHIDDTSIAIIATAVEGVLSLIITLVARKKVTPISDPRIEG